MRIFYIHTIYVIQTLNDVKANEFKLNFHSLICIFITVDNEYIYIYIYMWSIKFILIYGDEQNE